MKRLAMALTIGLGGCAIFLYYTGPYRSFTGLDVYSVSLVPCVVAFLLALATYVLAHLERKAAEESEAVEALKSRRGGRGGVFDDGAEPLYLAEKAVGLYKIFAPYVVGILVSAVALTGAIVYWLWMRSRVVGLERELASSQSAVLTVIVGAVFLFSGIFCIGQSRETGFRWLRSVGCWLVFTALAQGLALAGVVFLKIGFDRYAALFLIVCLCALGVEAFLFVLMEFLRPRSGKGVGEGAPLFESRLLAFLAEPGGMRGQLENALDYQFGFKISKTRMYYAWQRSVLPLLLFWLLTLWLLTCVQEVGIGQMGLIERFGRRVDVAPLESGVFLKMPWPITNIRSIPVDIIQEIQIGSKAKDEGGKSVNADTVLWTEKHYAVETKFIVGAASSTVSPEPVGEVSGDGLKKAQETERGQAAPVSYVVTSARIQYRVRKSELASYAYKFDNPTKTLEDMAEGVLVKHLARLDFIDFLSANRMKTCELLKKEVQAAADKAGLGVDILLFNLLDSHPPVEEVAPAFQNVIGAKEEKETLIQAAHSYAIRAQQQSLAQADRMVMDAKAYRGKNIQLAEAEAERYGKQLVAYLNEPNIYRLRAFLSLLEESLPKMRKYIMAAKPENEVFILDLQEKPFINLLGSSLMNDEQKAAAPQESPAAPPPGQ